MLFIVAYSCFSAAYFTAFGFPKTRGSSLAYFLEDVVFVSFGLDIIFNFFRVPENYGEEKPKSHFSVAKLYLKSGTFFLDLLVTFPFYLTSISDSVVWIKLLRIAKIPRMF
jgi:hypothetical protein